MYNDYDFTTVSTTSAGSGYEWLVSLLLGMWFIIIALLVFTIIVKWKVFKKAGREGWESIIPVYNNWVLFEISGSEGWYALLAFVPIIGSIAFLILLIMAYTKLAKRFGKKSIFALGLIFMPVIFFAILAFDKSTYSAVEETVVTA